jgi:hypothetical protein
VNVDFWEIDFKQQRFLSFHKLQSNCFTCNWIFLFYHFISRSAYLRCFFYHVHFLRLRRRNVQLRLFPCLLTK